MHRFVNYVICDFVWHDGKTIDYLKLMDSLSCKIKMFKEIHPSGIINCFQYIYFKRTHLINTGKPL